MDANGGYEEMKVFTGPDALEQAVRYAQRRFGDYDQVKYEPCRR